jgi:hypothetical protein
MAKPQQVALEVAGREVIITNPEKVYFPQAGYTKLDLARYYGAVGAAAAAAMFNLASFTVGIQIMHRRLLRGELQRFYLQDVAKPALAAIAVVLLARLVYPPHVPWMLQVAFLGAIFALSRAAAAMSAPATRDTALNMLRRFRRR